MSETRVEVEAVVDGSRPRAYNLLHNPPGRNSEEAIGRVASPELGHCGFQCKTHNDSPPPSCRLGGKRLSSRPLRVATWRIVKYMSKIKCVYFAVGQNS